MNSLIVRLTRGLYGATFMSLQRRLLLDLTKNSKRYLQTINQSAATQTPAQMFPMGGEKNLKDLGSKWNAHGLASKPLRKPLTKPLTKETEPVKTATPKRRRRQLKPRKALITVTPKAIEHLRHLMDQPTPQYIKVGVQNRGCSGLSYHLEYVEKPEKFDEVVKIDDRLMIIIDSKALFSIIGSEMDYVDDKLSSRFVFNNPNAKGSCGCGESFMV